MTLPKRTLDTMSKAAAPSHQKSPCSQRVLSLLGLEEGA